MGSCFLRGGVHALEGRFHAFEKGVKQIFTEGVHIYENNIIFIILGGSRF